MAYTVELYANNARTTLAGSANNTVTTLVLQSGAGALFPSPNNLIGEFAKATLQDAATGLRNEIIYITARTGDILTVVRGQDGSTAQTWSAGDTVFEGVTAATLASFVQPSTLQNCQYTHAVAAGTADAITATYTPAYASWVDGMTFFIRITADNTTTTPTVSPNGLAAKTSVKGGGIALKVSDLIIGQIAEFKYNSTLDKVVLQNPSITGGLLNIQVFTASGTYIETPGTKSRVVYGCGGGESGGLADSTTAGTASAASGGSSGSHGKTRLGAGITGIAVTIGAGGVAAFSATCAPGGTTSFGAFLTCEGGSGGTYGAAISLGTSTYGIGGIATGGNIYNAPSGLPNSGIVLSALTFLTGNGGSTPWGTGGHGFSGISSVGQVGRGYGSGGGGGGNQSNVGTQKLGGNGKAGILFVEEYS